MRKMSVKRFFISKWNPVFDDLNSNLVSWRSQRVAVCFHGMGLKPWEQADDKG